MSPYPEDSAQPVGSELVEDEIPCVYCGYLLRGLEPEGECPECGSPIERSLRGDLLCYADPDWLARLRRGVSLILWYIALLFLLIILSMFAGILFAATNPGGASGQAVPINVIMQGLGVLLGLVYLVGIFLVTAPEPRIADLEDPVTLRRTIRTCTIVAVIGGLLEAGGGANTSSAAQIVKVLGGVFQIAGIVAFFGLFVYFRRLALRIPDHDLARSTRTVMWGIVISYGALIVGGTLMAIFFYVGSGGTGGSAAAMFGGVLGCGVIVALIVFVIWTIRLLTHYRKALRAAEDIAVDLDTSSAVVT